MRELGAAWLRARLGKLRPDVDAPVSAVSAAAGAQRVTPLSRVKLLKIELTPFGKNLDLRPPSHSQITIFTLGSLLSFCKLASFHRGKQVIV
jgi:hypothetical protein